MSGNSYHDGNGIHTLLAVETDGKTLINIQASPSSHALSISNGSTGSDSGPTNSRHDSNHVPIFMATSNDGNNTPIAIYADVNGNLLVNEM